MRPADRYEGFLFDLDGVVYRGDEPIPGAAPTIATLRDLGRGLVFATNNSARTPEQVSEKLRRVGVEADPQEVVTSAQAVAPLVRRLAGDGARAFVVGEEGLRAALGEAGIEIVDGDPSRVDAVVVGWDRAVDYAKLRRASVLVQRGARLVATNADSSYPAPGGEAWPGSGAILAVIETTTGVAAEVAGKPHPPLFEEAVTRLGTRRVLAVGDRIETDIAGALAAGLDAALVLTGAATAGDIPDAGSLPSDVLPDLTALLEDRPDPGARTATASDGEAVASLVASAGLPEPPPGSSWIVFGEEPEAVAGYRVEGDDAYLHSVCSSRRGRGTGTLVAAAALRAARAAGAARAYLLTEEAQAFFRRLGFQPVAREALPPAFVPLTVDCAAAVVMRRALSGPTG